MVQIPRLAFLHREIDILSESGPLLCRVSFFVRPTTMGSSVRWFVRRFPNDSEAKNRPGTTNRKTANLIRVSRAALVRWNVPARF